MKIYPQCLDKNLAITDNLYAISYML